MLQRVEDTFMIQKANGSLAKTNTASIISLMTGEDVTPLYEDQANVNRFTDALLAKLNAIDAAHYLPPVQDVASLVAMPEATLIDKARVYVESETTDYFYDAQAVSGSQAPADQTGGTGFWRQVVASGESAASIKAKYESNADTNALTDSLLASISASAAAVTTNASDIAANAAAITTNAAGIAANLTATAANATAIQANTDAQHAEGSILGDATTNPIVIAAGQVFSLDFSQLPVA